MGRLTLAIGAFILGGASLFASPKHGSVEHGHATFQSTLGGIEIHSGNKTIINWESFSIDAGEIARFCQSSSASAVLNRVIGSEQSLINGLLTSNGHVFLLNQNGILIGKDGVIDTAGFVASTLDLSNDQFLKGGDFLFKGDGKGSVINLGTIHTRGGDVFLIGYHVSNEGTIQTDGGVAGLASGAEVFLAVEGEERLFIRKGIDSEEVGVSNDGVIRAAEVEIKASGNPFALAIKHGGEIEATGVAHRNGRVLLVADSGKTEVAGSIQAESGMVHVLGDEVTLTETAAIDVSGDVGGEVLVGGDYKGSNPDIPNSRRTYIYKGAEVRADGHHGDGGKVIVWGTDRAYYFGDISAAAFGEVGDGGFVEISAKSNDYIFKGPVKASSVNGANGTLLLDPVDITVSNTASSPPFPQGGANTYKPSEVSSADLDPADIVPILGVGNTNVLIDSTDAAFGSNGNGDVEFQDDVIWNGTGILSVVAYRSIEVNSGVTISATGGGGINFTAQGNEGSDNDGININGSLMTTNGGITLDGNSAGGGSANVVGVDVNGTITTVDGPISITGVSHGTGSATHGIDIAGTISSTGTGTITFDGTGSTSGSTNSTGVNLDGATVSSNSGLIDITGVGGTGVGLNEGIFIQNSASVTSTTGGITMDGTGDGTNTDNHGISVENSGLIRSITSGDINLTGTTTSGASQNTDGILMRVNAEVRSEGSGNIMMTGIGQAPGIGLGELSGIDIIISNVIATGTGTIDLIGHCNENSEFSEGVKFQGNSSISSTSGKITITGSNTSNLQASHGVAFESSTATIQTTGGDIEISGTSTMGDTTSYGFFMPNGSTISTTGSGSIEITGDIASGTGTTGQNGVEISGASTSVTTVNGDITVTGRSGGTSGSSYGVLLTNSSTIQSTGSGNVTLDGTSRATGGSGNVGVQVDGNSTLSGVGGVVSMIGAGGTGTSGNHGAVLPTPATATVLSPGGLTLDGTSSSGTTSLGVWIPTGATAQTSGAGAISITGNATGTGTGSDGVLIEGNVTPSGAGAVSVNGTSSGDARHGIFAGGNVSAGIGGITFMASTTGTGISDAIVIEGIVSTTSTGPIGMTGTVSGSAGTSDGIDIRSGGRVTSVDGTINLMGTSNAIGLECTGIEIQQNGGVQSTGTGSVTLTGVGSTTGTDETRGVKVTSNAIAPSFISVNNGNLIINGTGNGTATENEGFLLGIPGDLGSFVTSTGTGNITINGMGSSTGTTENAGVRITGGLSVTSSGSGNITFVGQGGAGNDGYGVFVEAGSDVTASGTGAVSLTGTAGTGSGNTYGVYITDVSSTVTSNSGNASLTGTGGSGGGGSHNVGVFIENGGTLSSTSGVVSITGVGGNGTTLNHGVELVTTGTVTSPGGLVLMGTSSQGTGSVGVLISAGVTALTTGTGNISITGNANGAGTGNDAVLILGDVDSQGSGSVTIQGTSAATVGVNSNGVNINSVSGGGTVSAVDGLLTINGTSNSAAGSCDGVQFQGAVVSSTGLGVGPGIVVIGQAASGGSNDGIDLRGNAAVSTVNRDITFTGTMIGPHTDVASGIEIVGASSVTSTAGNLSFTGTGSSEGITIAGTSTVSTAGAGTITMDGTAGPVANSRGTRIDGGSTVSSADGALSISGTGSSSGETQGVLITGGVGVSTSGGGNIILDGTGGAGSEGDGVRIDSASTVQATGTGTLSATGVAGSGSGNVHGVYLTDAGTIASTNSGSLTLTGTGATGGGGSHNVGVFFENSSEISSVSGVVTLDGTGGNGTSLNHGIELVTGVTFSSSGGLVLDGTSSSGTNSRGVLLAPAITAQTAGAGNISITGVSSAGTGSPAVEIGGTVITPGTGTITIQGTSSGSAATSPGVLITSGTVSSTSGNITLTGTGNTGAALSEGISLNAGSISATGGNIQLTGTGQDASGSPVGIAVAGGSSLSTTGLGTMTLTTLAGDFTDSGVAVNTYDTQQGAFSLTSAGAVLFSAGLTSTITTTLGSASITANGGNIILDDSGSVTTAGGTANLTATSGAIQLGVVDVTNTGDIFITASGTVTDNSAALVNLIGDRGYISSGGTGPLPTLLNQFQGVTPTTGSIDLTNGQALELIAWNIPGNAVQTANNGDVAIVTTTGGITVTDDVSADGSGLIGLDASAGPGAISVLEDVSSGSGAITIIGGSVTHSVNGNLATGGGVIDVTATSGNITMNPGTSYSTGGGNALLVASNSALLNLINAGAGDINVTATAGTITNNSGANSPAILVGTQGTLTSALGTGSGTSGDATAIGTSLTQLNGSVTGGSGGIIIFEQGGLNLGNISATNGTVDISALNAITQVVGNILATDALFTTRAGNIGTVNVVNTSSLLLDASLAAGDLSIDVGANTLTLNGNTDVGGDYTVLAGTYDESTFTVRVGGTTNTPVPINPLNTVTASGLLDDFDISSVTLASSGNITVNLRGETYNVGNHQGANAIIINSVGNTITNSLTVTTVDPNLSPQQKDYNLVNSKPITLNPMQNFIVNAAKGQNFTPGVGNPKSSPFDNSPLNGFNGSTVNILNVAPSDNVFPGWVSIRDSYTTVFEAGPNLSTEYVNTYGDLTIRTTTGAIMTGATGETMRTGGALLTIESHGNLSIAGTVSNLTIPPVPLALNGIISYTSAIGSITGPALTQAAQVKLDAATGIGTGGQDLQINTPQMVFTAANDALIELSGAATVAGDSTSGAIDIETSGAGNLTIGSLTIDGLSRIGLTSAGVSGIQVVTIGGDILVDQLVTGNNGPIQLTASGAVTHGASGDLTTTGVNAINVTATSGAITMDPNTVYTTGNGFASLNAHTNINVAQINVGTGDIFLNSTTGGIVRVTGPPTNLIGGRGYALTSSGIGTAGNILQSSLSQFQGTVGGTGGIFLNDTAALQLTNWNGGTNSAQTNSGNIDIQTASGSLTVIQPVVAGGSGTIKLDANADAVVVNQTVTSNTGSITVMGNTGITHGMNGTVTVSSGAGGTVSETATTGDISMHGASKIITQGGNITLLADNDLNVAESNTGATGTITATATNGMIADTTTTLFLPNFVSDEVILQANSGIGSGVPSPSSATDISTVANFLTASTVTNDIVISELDGLTLRNISTQNGGHFFLEAGGLVTQDGGSTLQIDGNLTVVTSRASTLGTVSIVNSVNTDLGESEIAGNYTVNVTGDLSLSGDQFVGLDCNFQHTGTYTEAPFKVFHGGDYFVNGVDPDLQGATINATGPTPNFNLDLAMPFSADATITINLQGGIDTFSNTYLPDAIILTQAGNAINGTIDIETVDPMYQGTTPTNYHLTQTATPFTLNAGQTLIINAVRGTANPNVSGALGSPFSGLVDGSNLGSNITLNLANTSNGVISIRDPNLCSLNVNGDPIFSHVNTYNDLTITAPSGSITTGAFAQAVRSSGSLLRFTADQDVTLNQAVNALTTGGVPFGEIVYTANNGSITGAGPSQAVGVSFIAPLGAVTTVTQTTNCIFNAMTGVDILNANTTGNFGGTVSGSLTITQVGTGDLRVNSVTVDGVTRTGITALDQTVNLTNNAGAITQIAGNVNAGTTGTVNLSSVTGITGIGPSATFQTLSRDVLAINSSSGEVRVENRLNGSNALSSSVRLGNGPGNAAAGRNLYFRQVGGSSVDFQTVNANGTGTLLAISGSANMNFSGNVNMGNSVIAVANHNMEVGGVQFNLNTPNAVATLILDQESPTLPGSGTFVNAGVFNISSGNLAIYAASGPQAPATAIFDPPNQVTLGSLAPLATWDAGEPNGLDTKYATSYSDGGPYHGPGFGTNYTPGNGVFGSQVIWYKFDVDHAPPSPSGATSGRIPFDPRIGINAWEVEYFLQYWDVNLNRLGDQNVTLILVEENFETEPSSYRPHRISIDKLREKVSPQ